MLSVVSVGWVIVAVNVVQYEPVAPRVRDDTAYERYVTDVAAHGPEGSDSRSEREDMTFRDHRWCWDRCAAFHGIVAEAVRKCVVSCMDELEAQRKSEATTGGQDPCAGILDPETCAAAIGH